MTNVFDFDTHLLFLTALVTVAMQLTFFFIAASFKFDKVTDFAGGSNFVLLAWLTYLINGTFYWRQTMVTLAVTAWGARLSGYLLYRILKIGKDDRFDGTREDFCKFLAFWVYQMFWVWTVSLPVTFLNTTAADPGLDARDVAGAAMFVAGFWWRPWRTSRSSPSRARPAIAGNTVILVAGVGADTLTILVKFFYGGGSLP
ncbi:unnamed protein product [Heterosigma akashiwo]